MGQTYDHNHEGTSESPPEKEPEKINPHTQNGNCKRYLLQTLKVNEIQSSTSRSSRKKNAATGEGRGPIFESLRASTNPQRFRGVATKAPALPVVGSATYMPKQVQQPHYRARAK